MNVQLGTIYQRLFFLVFLIISIYITIRKTRRHKRGRQIKSTKILRRVTRVEQELLPIQSTCVLPCFRSVLVVRSLVFCVVPFSFSIVVCPFVLFLLAIVLSVFRCNLRLLITYPLGIFKLFLRHLEYL